MNYGNQIGAVYDASQVTTDLTYIIKTCGIHYIRIAYPLYTDQSFDSIEAAALVAKSLGAYVTVGLCAPAGFGTAQQPAYTAAVLSFAAWTQANQIDEFQVGNEMELAVDGTTMTAADVPPYVRSLAAQVKAARLYRQGRLLHRRVIYPDMDQRPVAGHASFAEAKAAIREWITWYNEGRPHQALSYLSPHQYRAQQLLAVA